MNRIRNTVDLLSYYRHFIASASTHALDPRSRWGETMDKAEARRWLHYMIHTAINRRAGISAPDTDQERAFIQDRRDLTSALHHRTFGPRRFRTSQVQRRFGHVLDR